MSTDIREHTGSKYIRRIFAAFAEDGKERESIHVDFYNIAEACEVRCPAIAHALKKLLYAGLRGKGECMEDLVEARDAISRAIQLENDRQQLAKRGSGDLLKDHLRNQGIAAR